VTGWPGLMYGWAVLKPSTLNTCRFLLRLPLLLSGPPAELRAVLTNLENVTIEVPSRKTFETDTCISVVDRLFSLGQTEDY
jgi:hypothetical protein